MLILTRKFADCSYRLHMAGINTKQAEMLCFRCSLSLNTGKFLIRLDQMEENLTLKNKEIIK